MNGQSSKLKTIDIAVQVANNQGVVLTINILNSSGIEKPIPIVPNSIQMLSNHSWEFDCPDDSFVPHQKCLPVVS